MKSKLMIPVISILLFGYISQSRGQELSYQQRQVIENQIDSIFQEMLVFAEKLDYEKLSTGVDDRHHAGFITNGKYYPKYTSLIDVVKSSAQGVSNQRISIREKKITALSDSIALLTTSGESDVFLNDGAQFNVNFYWSFVFEKNDYNWKVIHSHQSRNR